MIFVSRTQQPDSLRRFAVQWLLELEAAHCELARCEADSNTSAQVKQASKKKFEKSQNKYRRVDVKTALIGMFHGKCAYCESQVSVVTYGQIEHFYPKGRYMDKTFQWDNLLLSCDLCNNSGHKGTKFPLDVRGEPLLIDPTRIRPENHLRFSWDQQAGLACIYGNDPRGEETIKTFDLNGDSGRKSLLKRRCEHVKIIMALAEFAENGNEEAAALLREEAGRDRPYSAFAAAYISGRLIVTT